MSVRIKKNIFGKCSVVYDCPKCRTVLRSSIDQIGKEDFCPVCDATFIVPGKVEFAHFLDRKRAAAEVKAQIRAAAKEKKVTKPHVLNVSAPVSVQGMSDSQTAPSPQPAFCSSCGTKLAVDGTFCSCCGKPLTVVVNPKSAAASGILLALSLAGCLGYIGAAVLIFIVLGVIGSLMNDDTPTSRRSLSPADGSQPAAARPEGLTGPRGNAVRSAKQYLSLQGFSRSGLIQQLSSDYGDGYSIADATAAVDSLNVDWNKQAVRSAQQYLSMHGFSCKGLIEQLSSSAGDKYTVSQATYGAQQAGACQ